MNIITCKLKDKIETENGGFYVIKELNSAKEHYIPENQIEIVDGIFTNKVYDFYIEKDPKTQKNFFNLVHPNYLIGEVYSFSVDKIVEIENQKYFELESEYKEKLLVNAFPWQHDFQDIFCKIKSYKKGYPVLENNDTRGTKWKIGEVLEFPVKGFSYYLKGDKKINTIIVDIDGCNELFVNSGKWHLENIWKFPTVFCQIIGLSYNGLPKLIIKDSRHPLYEIGKFYSFVVVGFKTKQGKTNNKFKVIELTDYTNIIYEVQSIPNQELRLKIGQSIDCEVKEINFNLSLYQVNYDDPFFYDYDEIIDDKNIKEKYFLRFLNEDNEFNARLKSQYEQKSGFWVFTYCNYILNKLKSECAYRKDINEGLLINDIHTKFEKWILHKGILRAIHNEEERKNTKQKINHILKVNEAEKESLETLLSFKYSEFIDRLNEDFNFVHLYYFLRFSNPEKLELSKISTKLVEFHIDNKFTINSDNYHYIKKIINHIDYVSNSFQTFNKRDYFILNRIISDKDKDELTDYVTWLFITYQLYLIIEEVELSNLLLSKMYRTCTLFMDSVAKKSTLLLNAFYIISNIKKNHICVIKFLKNELIVDLDDLVENPNSNSEIRFTDSIYKINVIEKKSRGFSAVYNSMPGFLPIQNVFDYELKYQKRESLDWSITAEFTLYSKEFNYFVAKQLPLDSNHYFSSNNKKQSLAKSGDIIFGTVQNITDFGFFVNTDFGNGLVHISNISNYYLDKNSIPRIFKIGMRLPFYVLDHSNNKLQLSLSRLMGTQYEKKYIDIIKFYDFYLEDDLESAQLEKDVSDVFFQVELEKGYIFETYAAHQISLENKIKYIKFAKVFFSNTFNSRSYLLNIYLEYFASLHKLDNLLLNYTYEKYQEFKRDILVIKDKVQPKTLENFPESKNLLFFIDILSLFNSKNEDDIESLFQLIRKPFEENDLILKTVAKIALANNLIISELNNANEIKEINEFTFNNLKRIREFISQGVLSVKDTPENKLLKELKEKRNYWIEKISLDEGEKLEFKATLLTPIPSNQKNKILESLRKQLDCSIDDISKSNIKERIKIIEEESRNVKGIDKILIHSAFKTICAFANTNGGHLLLGVTDDKKIFGLEQDYNSFSDKKNRDEFGKKFDELLKEYFGDSFSSLLLEKEFLKFPEGDILIIEVKKSNEEIFLLKNEKGEKEENLYVRNLSSSIKLKGIELAKFIRTKVKQNIQL